MLVFISLCMSFVFNANALFREGGTHPPRWRLLRMTLNLLVVPVYLYLLSFIPVPKAVASSDLFTSVLSRLIGSGTIILGLLSGFGAISNAWAFFGRSR
jgi:hypothetical protein